jgi:hypothetical protein
VEVYRVVVFGFPTIEIAIGSLPRIPRVPRPRLVGVLVIAGVMIAMRRRMRDEGRGAAALRRGLHAADPALRSEVSRDCCSLRATAG